MREDNPKKLIIIYILKILDEYTDENHKLSQGEIISLIKEKYGVECERKAIGRNILALQEAGYEIVSNKSGTYMSGRQFEASELRLLIDSVLCNRYINANHSREMITKLSKLGGRYFDHYTSNIQCLDSWSKSRNQNFLLNIELVDEAINEKKQIRFFYNRYDSDLTLKETSRRKSVINPYSMVMHNQRYYLIGNVDKYNNIAFYRMDKITDMEILPSAQKPIEQLPDYEKGLDFGALSTTLPYMFSDDPIDMAIKCDKKIMDDIVDWFGTDISIEDIGDDVVIRIHASPTSLIYWLMQYSDKAEIVEPHYMRGVMAERANDMIYKYTGKRVKLNNLDF